ncbi:hypothetical protein SVAN01_01071 [Stagonosporopsis vannaccii]|nr:hypothetical protein SVAN01_01071 [Stagonosporopsis vannaccii]
MSHPASKSTFNAARVIIHKRPSPPTNQTTRELSNKPRQPTVMPTLRLVLLSQTFWRVLPATYGKIKQRWIKIAKLRSKARSDFLPSDRAGESESLKAELHIPEKDIEEYRSIAKKIDIMDVAEMYIDAGKARRRALQIVKVDFENMESSLKIVEDRGKETKAELVYGFERQA